MEKREKNHELRNQDRKFTHDESGRKHKNKCNSSRKKILKTKKNMKKKKGGKGK